MGSMTRAFILIAMVACLTSVAHAIAGQATFYTPPYTRIHVADELHIELSTGVLLKGLADDLGHRMNYTLD
ncbi:hypothetical protein Tco_1025881 [Tanacetum coccineum]